MLPARTDCEISQPGELAADHAAGRLQLQVPQSAAAPRRKTQRREDEASSSFGGAVEPQAAASPVADCRSLEAASVDRRARQMKGDEVARSLEAPALAEPSDACGRCAGAATALPQSAHASRHEDRPKSRSAPKQCTTTARHEPTMSHQRAAAGWMPSDEWSRSTEVEDDAGERRNQHDETPAAREQSSRADAPAGMTTSNPSAAAPSVAPEGRTLEHEVLEDEETEFQPVPDDLSAMSEVAGDEELVLEEETLDSDNGYSERWIPKIDDVDEDEVVAAESAAKTSSTRRRGRGGRGGRTAKEEAETNGRAEVRAASPTVGYQQRQPSVRATASRLSRSRRAVAVRAATCAPVPTAIAISRSSPTC